MTSSADGSQSRSMDEIESLATAHACRRDALAETVEEAQAALDRVKRDYRAALRRRLIVGSVPAAAHTVAEWHQGRLAQAHRTDRDRRRGGHDQRHPPQARRRGGRTLSAARPSAGGPRATMQRGGGA